MYMIPSLERGNVTMCCYSTVICRTLWATSDSCVGCSESLLTLLYINVYELPLFRGPTLICVAMALNHLQNTMGHFGLRLPTHSPHTTEPSNTDQLIPHVLRRLFIHISVYPTHLTVISKYSKSSNIYVYQYSLKYMIC